MRKIYYIGTLSDLFYPYYQKATAQTDVQVFLNHLLTTKSFKECPSLRSIVYKLFIKSDRTLIDQCIFEIQALIDAIGAALIHGVQEKEQEALYYLVWRLCDFIPFCDPKPGCKLRMPVKDGKNWKMSTYVLDIQDLTTNLVSPLICVQGKSENGRPFLLFKGTPFTTSKGCLLSLWTDFVPCMPVGRLAFLLSVKKRLQPFFDSVEGDVLLSGQSLGGSLALMTAEAFSPKVSEVIAFCPAGYKPKCVIDASVTIIYQKRDPVPFVGRDFPKEFKRIYIETEEQQNPYMAHMRCMVPLVPMVMSDDQTPHTTKRLILTVAHTLISFPIFIATSLALCIRLFIPYRK